MTPLDLETRNLDVSLADRIPAGLYRVLERVSRERYGELYEGSAGFELEAALRSIVEALGEYSQDAGFSYVCLALILGMAVRPTIQRYLPDEDFTLPVLRALVEGRFTESLVENEFKENYSGFLGQYQALDEAIWVLENSLEVLNQGKAPNVLVEILDLCLEGYAIFPGSLGRRDLLDWVLWEAIPAACLGVFPPQIYTIRGLGESDHCLKVVR